MVFVNGSLVAIAGRLNSSELQKKGLCIHLNQAAGTLLKSNKCSPHDKDSMFLKIHYIYNTNVFNRFIIIEFCKRAYSLLNSILFEFSFKPTVSGVCHIASDQSKINAYFMFVVDFLEILKLSIEPLSSLKWTAFQKKLNWNNFLRSVLSGSFHPISDFVADWNSQDTDLHDNTL